MRGRFFLASVALLSLVSIGSAFAEGDEPVTPRAPDSPALDLAAPELPAPLAGFGAPSESQSTANAEATDPLIAPPDLPPVTVVVEPELQRPSIADVDIAPPDLPEARVVVDAPKPAVAPATEQAKANAADIAVALKARLDDERASLHPRLTRALRDDIAAVYASRAHAPLWIDESGVSPAGRAIAAQLRSADDDGLDASSYILPELDAARADPAAFAAYDLGLSVAAIVYARDARGGRIDARRLSSLIDPTIDMPGGADALQTLSAASDAGAALAAYNPPHEGYRQLRAKLRELRSGTERVAVVTIPQGPVLRVGMNDARVALVRERLKIEPLSDTTYDTTLAEAVAGFQRQRGLPANGALTRQTTAALSGPPMARLEADIVANMERWRWLPRDLGQRHVAVNIPEFQVRVMDGGAILHQARVIVGKPDTPTPVFSDAMQFLVVNPSWFVPPSILKNEFLPRMAQDPSYAARRGYQVTRRGNSITIRQPPGERNALGHIKFMFPNRHAVYLHDTPTRHLFGADRRAFSHGCVRVDQPFRLAEIVLGKERGWSEGRVRSLVGRGEQTVKMGATLPIHLTYFTTFVDDLGRLQQRDDLYGHNRRVRAALGLDG